MSLIIAPDLYNKPPLAPVPGARWDFRKWAAAVAQLVNANIIALVPIPAYCYVLGFCLEVDTAMDTGNTMTLDVGVLNSYYNGAVASAANPGIDLGTSPAVMSGYTIITGSTIGRAGGRIDYSATAFTQAIGSSQYTRIMALKISAAVGTGVAGGMYLGLLLDAA